MKTFTNRAAQGELMFIRVPERSVDGLKEITPDQHGRVIVGHSETGHHHVMTAEKTRIYDLPEELTKLLVVTEKDILRHLRETDTHEDTLFTPGYYLVRNAREFDGVQARQSMD